MFLRPNGTHTHTHRVSANPPLGTNDSRDIVATDLDVLGAFSRSPTVGAPPPLLRPTKLGRTNDALLMSPPVMGASVVRRMVGGVCEKCVCVLHAKRCKKN